MRAILGLLLALVAAAPAAGQSVRVVASIDATAPLVGDDVRYDLDITGAAIDGVGQPRLPELSGLEAVALSPVVSRVEGTGLTPRVRYRWTLRATRAGRARIAEAFVPVAGQLVVGNAVSFTVRPDPDPSAAAPSGSAAPSKAPPRSRLADGDVFVRARRVPAGTVWQGEQVVVEWQLFARPDLDLTYRIVDAGAATGFWREDLPVNRSAAPTLVSVGGRRFSRIVIRRVALFPQQAGALAVAPIRIEGTARVPLGASLFGLDDAPRIDETFARTSDALSIGALALPSPPADFSGLTGNAAVSATVARRDGRTGDGLDIAVTVRGDAALATMPPPRIALDPAAADLYDAQSDSTRREAGARFQGSRTFRYTLVPRRVGRLDLPEVVVTRFDVRTRRYVREAASLGAVNVSAGTAAPEPTRPSERRTVRPATGFDRRELLLVGAMMLGLGVMALGALLALRRRGGTTAPPPLTAPPARTPAPSLGARKDSPSGRLRVDGPSVGPSGATVATASDAHRWAPAATTATASPDVERASSVATAHPPARSVQSRPLATAKPTPAAAGPASPDRQVLDALGRGDARRAADVARRHLAAAVARRIDRPVLPAAPAIARALDEAGVDGDERADILGLLDRLAHLAFAPGEPEPSTVGPLAARALDRARRLAA